MQQQWDGSLADEHKIQSSPCPKISNTQSQPVNQSPHLLLALVCKKDLILYIRDIRKANQESTLMLSPQCVFLRGGCKPSPPISICPSQSLGYIGILVCSFMKTGSLPQHLDPGPDSGSLHWNEESQTEEHLPTPLLMLQYSHFYGNKHPFFG